jgi:hypothetical protein
MQDFVSTYIVGNGWVGVALGIAMFAMGYWRGLERVNKIAPFIIDATIADLIENGFVKTRKRLEDGEWKEEMLRHDEEEI